MREGIYLPFYTKKNETVFFKIVFKLIYILFHHNAQAQTPKAKGLYLYILTEMVTKQ